MAERTNPYIAGAPVTDPRMFFGRQDVFSWIEHNVAGRYATNTLVIHGQRRVGKTSVLKQLDVRLPDRFVPVFYDLQGRTHATIDRFLWHLARQAVRTLRSRLDLELDRPDQDAFSRDPEFFATGFMAGLRQVLGSDRTLLIVFDEFDSLEEPTAKEMLGRDLIPFFSRILQGVENLNFVFSIGSSGHRLEQMQAGYTEFFRSALYKKISFLEPDQARQLIVQPVEGIVDYDRGAIKRIQAITSGHPYFTQLTCHEVFARCQQNGEWHVGRDDVEAVLPNVIERGTVNLKFVWDDATDEERYTLAALALSDGPTRRDEVVATLQEHRVRISEAEVAGALRNLSVKDVLANDNTFTVDLVHLWLMENKPIERVIEELIEQHPIAANFVRIAQEFRDREMDERALQSYESALETAPDFLPAHLGIAEIHQQAQRWQEALEAYRNVLKIDDEHIRARSGVAIVCLALGDAARDEGDITGAAEWYGQVLQVSAGHAEARERMAAIHLAGASELAGKKQWDAALEKIAQAAGYTPGALEIDEQERAIREAAAGELIARATALRGRKRFGEALEALERALAYAPDSEAVAREIEVTREPAVRELIDQAVTLRERKRFGQAIAALERAGRFVTDSSDLAREIEATREAERAEGLAQMLASGERALRAGRWEEAIGTFERFLAEGPEDQEAIARVQEKIEEAERERELADTYAAGRRAMEREEYRRAVDLFKQIINQDVDYRDTTQLLAEAVEMRQTQRRGLRRLLVGAGIVGGIIALAGLGWWLAQPTSPLMVALSGEATPLPTTAATAAATSVPASTQAPTERPLPSATPESVLPDPATWVRLWSAKELPRDTIWRIIPDPDDPNIIYAGTASGLYRSINGGSTWLPAHDGLGGGTAWALVMDPTSSQTLYTGVAVGGFFKTTDGAQSWQPINEGLEIPDVDVLPILALDPRDSRHLLCSPGRGLGLYETLNGGESWQQVPSSDCPAWFWHLAFHPIDEGTLFATSYANAESSSGCQDGLYISRDGGRYWTRTGLEIPEEKSLVIGFLEIDRQTGDYLYAIGWAGETYRSSDGGESWDLLDVNCTALTVDPDDGTTVYCVDGGGFLRRTADGGDSWQDIGNTGCINPRALAISTLDSNVMYVGGQGFCILSDGGETWEERSAGLGTGEILLMLDPTDGSRLFLQDDGSSRLYQSVDGGIGWTLAADRGRDLAIDAGGRTWYRHDNFDGVLRSVDGGETWESVAAFTSTVPIDVEDVAAHPVRSGTAYATGIDPANSLAYLFLTTDGWETYETIEIGSTPARLFFDHDQGNVVYAVSPQLISRSSDSGKTWETCAETGGGHPPRESSVAVDPQDGDRLAITTWGNGVLLSEDGCQSWVQINDGLGSLFIRTVAIDPQNPDTLYAGTHDTGAFVTFDGGLHWTEISEGLLGSPTVYSIVIDAQGQVYAATLYGIFALERE